MTTKADIKGASELPPSIVLCQGDLTPDVEIASAQAKQGCFKNGIFFGASNIVCILLGAGIVALPQALAKSSFYFGIPLIIIAMFCAGYAAVLLGKCGDLLIEQGVAKSALTYADIGEAAAGKWGRYLTVGSQVGQCVGSAILYLLLGAEMLGDIFSIETKYMVVICGGALIPFSLLRTFKEVTFFAIFGVLASTLVVFVLVITSVADVNHGVINQYGVHHSAPDFEGVALAFSTFAFSYGGHAMFVRIKTAMAAPQGFTYSVMMAFGFCTVMYIPVATVTYWKYGDILLNSDYDNALAIIADSNLRTFCYACVSAHVLITYVALLNPIFLYMESFMEQRRAQKTLEKEGDQYWKDTELFPYRWYHIVLRVVMVLFTIFVVEALPFFSYLQSLIGATTVVTLGFTFPPLFYMRLFKEKLTKKQIVLNWFIVLFGTAAAVCGTYFSIQGIVDSLSTFETWL
eukprot:Nk52_evm33s355 gene=Nk52_evmTU33s355